jgi:phosphoglycolate phosphatase-like HAD superfamily hydrolase
VTGATVDEGTVQMSGKTDPLIAMEIISLAGIGESEARAFLPKVLLALEEGLEREASRIRSEGHAHAGGVEALEALAADPRFLQSVLTGNLRANAHVKLDAFGLDDYLDLDVGAYGSDDHDRTRLIAVALDRAVALRGWEVEPRDVWIIGDTPRDLAAARGAGARCVLVATGRFGFDDLSALEADAVLPDLRDTARLLHVLRG